MKLISLSTLGFVLADSGVRSEFNSIYGPNAMKKREHQSRKMGYEDIGSNMQARKGNSLCSLRSNDPQFQCCDGVEISCFGCNGVLLDQGQQCDDQTNDQSFEQNRVRGRPHLAKKWKKITEKWYKRNENMTKNPCVFDSRSFDMTISDPTDSCQVSFNNMEFYDIIS